MARRAQHDTQFWALQVSQQKASGLSVREYCRRKGIEVHHFYYGRKRVMAGANTLRAQPPTSTVGRPSNSGETVPNANQLNVQPMVIIQLSDRTSVHVPVQMLDTIEAVLKMAQRLSAPESTPATGVFRSVIVRS
jgi:hypothetical protein